MPDTWAPQFVPSADDIINPRSPTATNKPFPKVIPNTSKPPAAEACVAQFVPFRDVRMVPSVPPTTKSPLWLVAARRGTSLLLALDTWLAQFVPSLEVRIVPPSPATRNNPPP